MKTAALIEEAIKEYIYAHSDYELPTRSYHSTALNYVLPIRNYAVKNIGAV